MGGLPRRATVIDEQPAAARFVVDAGNFAWKSARLPADRLAQQRRKAELLLDAFAFSGIDAVSLGGGDLVLGVPWLHDAAAAREVPLVLANLTCDGQAPFPPYRRIERDGVSLGVVGLLGADRDVAGCAVSSPTAALADAARALADVDLLIALSDGTDDDDTALAQLVPEVDLVINGRARLTRTTPRALPGSAVQLAAGSRGKKLGVAKIGLVTGASGFTGAASVEALTAKRDRFIDNLASARRNEAAAADARATRKAARQVEYYVEKIAELEAELADITPRVGQPSHILNLSLVELTRSVADNPDVAAMLEEANADIARLEAAAEIAPLEGGVYVGSAACASCHPAQHAQWSTTAHARAWQSLGDRTMDMACTRCHVTGAFDDRGPQHPAQVTAALQGVGCESCHGPGAAHAEGPAPGQLIRSPGVETCTQCHDGERDGGRFSPEDYRAKIEHGVEG